MSHDFFETHIDQAPRGENMREELENLEREIEGGVEKKTVQLSNGDTYRGDMIDGKFEGRGKYIRSDGHMYDGEFQNGSPFGWGTYTRSDGTKYEGGFVNGFMGAPSEEYDDKENRAYGIYTRPDGTQYKGIFINGRPANGEGLLIQGDKKETIVRQKDRPGYKDSSGAFRYRVFMSSDGNKLQLQSIYHNLGQDTPTTIPHTPPVVHPEDSDAERSSLLGEQR